MPAIAATAEQILLLERTVLDRWGRGEPAGYSDRYADDVRYFDPLVPMRIDGRDAMIAYYKPWTGQIHVPRYELLRPRVEVSGDMALLTYNPVNYVQHPDGTERADSCWNCTEVYVLRGDHWRILHSHWSFTAWPTFLTKRERIGLLLCPLSGMNSQI